MLFFIIIITISRGGEVESWFFIEGRSDKLILFLNPLSPHLSTKAHQKILIRKKKEEKSIQKIIRITGQDRG